MGRSRVGAPEGCLYHLRDGWHPQCCHSTKLLLLYLLLRKRGSWKPLALPNWEQRWYVKKEMCSPKLFMFPVVAVQLLFDSEPLLPCQGIQVMPELEDHAFCRQCYGNVCKHFIERGLCCSCFILRAEKKKNQGWEQDPLYLLHKYL